MNIIRNFVRVSGNQNVADIKTFTNTTDSTSRTTGALILNGGLGVAKSIQADFLTTRNFVKCSYVQTSFIEAGFNEDPFVINSRITTAIHRGTVPAPSIDFAVTVPGLPADYQTPLRNTRISGGTGNLLLRNDSAFVDDLIHRLQVVGKVSVSNRLNINSSDSDRNLALAIGEVAAGRSYDLTANPTGSFRVLNLDPQVKILSGAPAITRPLYGANLKIELNGTTGTSKTGGTFAINAYSLISGSGHTVDKNVGISVLADCGSNLIGTTVTENTSLEVFGVSSRGSTVISNARTATITPPNHGTNRRGLLIAAEGTTGLSVGANNISFENLGTSRFVGVATFVNSPIFIDGFVAQANSVCSSLLFTNGRRGALRNVSSNYNVTSTDEAIVANATTGAITITMPSVVANVGGKFTIIKGDSSGNTVTVTPINGSTRVLSSQYSFVSCVCDGTTWIATS